VNSGIYEVKLDAFAGPFDKLLELIEEKKLDINAVSLSEVTADFLGYITSLESKDPAIVADFLVVAARLILLKSKTLIPQLVIPAEEEEEIGNLEERLRMYRAYKKAAVHIQALALRRTPLFAKEYLHGLENAFYPAPNMSTSRLYGAIASIFAVFQEFVMEQKNIKGVVLRLEERIAHILQALKGNAKLFFAEIAKNASRSEVVVSFLAVLHLLKHQQLDAQQTDTFGAIEITKIAGSEN
jgi:segregation and condensation protein A